MKIKDVKQRIDQVLEENKDVDHITIPILIKDLDFSDSIDIVLWASQMVEEGKLAGEIVDGQPIFKRIEEG